MSVICEWMHQSDTSQKIRGVKSQLFFQQPTQDFTEFTGSLHTSDTNKYGVRNTVTMPSSFFLMMIVVLSLVVTATAFVTPTPPGPLFRTKSSIDSSTSTSTTTTSQSPIEFVQDLLLQLSSPDSDTDKGQLLLQASSEKWRQAIYQAIGAPSDASSTKLIAKSLQEKMSRPDSQFAILMDQNTMPFTMAFPSDIVDYRNDGTVWLECQLRQIETNQLFVIMGISLIVDEVDPSSWKILSLDWQDFREAFYPGLSGREWLRAF